MPSEQIKCPDCGEPMRRDRRIVVQGHTPFRCSNGHMAVDDAEPHIEVERMAGFSIFRRPDGTEYRKARS